MTSKYAALLLTAFLAKPQHARAECDVGKIATAMAPIAQQMLQQANQKKDEGKQDAEQGKQQAQQAQQTSDQGLNSAQSGQKSAQDMLANTNEEKDGIIGVTTVDREVVENGVTTKVKVEVPLYGKVKVNNAKDGQDNGQKTQNKLDDANKTYGDAAKAFGDAADKSGQGGDKSGKAGEMAQKAMEMFQKMGATAMAAMAADPAKCEEENSTDQAKAQECCAKCKALAAAAQAAAAAGGAASGKSKEQAKKDQEEAKKDEEKAKQDQQKNQGYANEATKQGVSAGTGTTYNANLRDTNANKSAAVGNVGLLASAAGGTGAAPNIALGDESLGSDAGTATGADSASSSGSSSSKNTPAGGYMHEASLSSSGGGEGRAGGGSSAYNSVMGALSGVWGEGSDPSGESSSNGIGDPESKSNPFEAKQTISDISSSSNPDGLLVAAAGRKLPNVFDVVSWEHCGDFRQRALPVPLDVAKKASCGRARHAVISNCVKMKDPQNPRKSELPSACPTLQESAPRPASN